MAIIETKDLAYRYSPGTPFEKTAVDGVNIQVEKGEFLGVIGHTGSGKSTLIQMLNGLLRPTSGQVLLNGKDIWAEPKKIRAVRFQVGMVFQYPEYQLFEETVLKDIMFGPKNMGLTDQEAETRAREAAHFTGLKEELLEKSPFELSGGEKRRAAIAGVIAMDPEVLILDDIGRTADRILVMNHGHAAMLDETKKVFARGPELEEMGLRVPQITKIMQELVAMGLPVDASTLTVDDALHQLIPILKRKEELR